jgi:hypothetical protein
MKKRNLKFCRFGLRHLFPEKGILAKCKRCNVVRLSTGTLIEINKKKED